MVRIRSSYWGGSLILLLATVGCASAYVLSTIQVSRSLVPDICDSRDARQRAAARSVDGENL